MVFDTSIFAKDLQYAIADLPCTLEWSGQTITGTRSEISESIDIDGTGSMEIHDLVVVMKITDFADSILPQERVTVTVDDVMYHIVTTIRSQDDIAVTFGLARNIDVGN